MDLYKIALEMLLPVSHKLSIQKIRGFEYDIATVVTISIAFPSNLQIFQTLHKGITGSGFYILSQTVISILILVLSEYL